MPDGSTAPMPSEHAKRRLTCGAPVATTAPGKAKGRLILVSCPDIGRLELLLGAALRRLDPGVAVLPAEPISTNHLPAGSGTRISRSAFAALEAAGKLVLTWTENGGHFAYGIEVLHRLAEGRSVVAGIRSGCGVEMAARNLCPNVTVIRLDAGTEALRAPFQRTMSDVRVLDVGGVAPAVRELTAAIRSILPPAPEARKGLRKAPVELGKPDNILRDRDRGIGELRMKVRQSASGRALKPQVRVTPAT